MICVQLANGHNNEVDVIDVRKDECRHFFQDILPQYEGTLYVQNGIFDLSWLKHYYDILYFKDVYDTKLAYQVINAGRASRSNLAMQAKQYLDIDLDKGIRDEFLLPMFQIMDLTEAQLQYGSMDAWVLPRIAEKQQKEIQEYGLEKTIWLENQVLPAFCKARLAGLEMDVDGWIDIYEEEKAIAAEKREAMLQYTDATFNPNSQPQLKAALRKLGIDVPVVYGKETTAAEHISKIKHPFIEALLEYRAAEKRASTYGEEFLDALNPVTGFLHTDFMQVGTVTGRVASREPNFQNIPKRDGGEKYRRCFIAGEDHQLIACDFTGQEIMVMAEASQDPALIAIYQEGLDRHQKTASDLFGVPYDEVTPAMRKIAKTFNFGVSYGSSAYNMANKLGMPLDVVESKLEDYWTVYSTLKKWQRRAGLVALRDGYSTTFWGRRRWFPDLSNKGSIMRQGANMEIQGTSADMTKYATVLIDRELEKHQYNATFVNFVHDEDILRAHKSCADEVAAMVKEQMEIAGAEFVTCIKQKAEVNMGDYWM
jgi:DNA polymerase-1